jgi:hypothetical protein
MSLRKAAVCMPVNAKPPRTMLLFVRRNDIFVEENFFSFMRRDFVRLKMVYVVFVPQKELPTFATQIYHATM